jgi:hypothetical protein
LVGATDGLHVFEGGREKDVAHSGRRVTALGRDGDETWAILDRREVHHTVDGAWPSSPVAVADRELTCIADTDAGVFVGVAEAHLARVADGAIEPVAAFEDVDGRDGWYTPWGGPPDVRSIAEDDDTIYVNVHVGGIVRTRDGGATWEPTIDIDADVHRVWADTDTGMFAACARGMAESHDRGDTWSMRSEGLHAAYCRGVTVCGDTILLSASRGPRGGQAAVYRAPVAGGVFEKCRSDLPEWFDDNVDSAWLDAMPELAAFGTGDGRVFASEDEGSTWHEVAGGMSSIACVAVVP